MHKVQQKCPVTVIIKDKDSSGEKWKTRVGFDQAEMIGGVIFFNHHQTWTLESLCDNKDHQGPKHKIRRCLGAPWCGATALGGQQGPLVRNQHPLAAEKRRRRHEEQQLCSEKRSGCGARRITKRRHPHEAEDRHAWGQTINSRYVDDRDTWMF